MVPISSEDQPGKSGVPTAGCRDSMWQIACMTEMANGAPGGRQAEFRKCPVTTCYQYALHSELELHEPPDGLQYLSLFLHRLPTMGAVSASAPPRCFRFSKPDRSRTRHTVGRLRPRIGSGGGRLRTSPRPTSTGYFSSIPINTNYSSV